MTVFGIFVWHLDLATPNAIMLWIMPIGGHTFHYDDVILGAIASQITSLTIVYSTVYSDADQRKHQSYASLAFVLGIRRWPVNSPHKGPVTRKMFPFDDVIMYFGKGIIKWFILLSLQDIHMYIIGIFVYNYVTQKLPHIFENYFQQNKDVHELNTRQANDFHVPFSRLQVRRFSIN